MVWENTGAHNLTSVKRWLDKFMSELISSEARSASRVSDGKRIYHGLGQQHYEKTRINDSKGER